MQSTIIIAGASQGLGKAFADYALSKGYSVCLLARTVSALATYQQQLKNEYPDLCVDVFECDLADAEMVHATFQIIKEQCGKIKALVNCAATWTGGKPIKEIDTQAMQHSINLNFFTAFNPIKALLELPDDRRAMPMCIVNVGATASVRGGAKMAAFAVPKCAVRVLSQSLARELAPDGIHVCHVIIDGFLDNERTRGLNPDLVDNQFINMNSVASSILSVIEQEPSCWTFEWDIRPFTEKW